MKETSNKKFRADKANWQWQSAVECYCTQFGKQPEQLTDADKAIIWEYAGNHMAFFLTWLLRHDFLGEMHLEDPEEQKAIAAVKQKTMTGADYFMQYCDMVFCREDVAEAALPFVDAYYETKYVTDYCAYMTEEKVLSTAFSWEDYMGFEPVLDRAYRAYNAENGSAL